MLFRSCYLRNPAFKTKEQDYHVSADLTGQANHLGVTIEADIIKQKLPENNGGYNALKFGKTSPLVYSKLTTDHPIIDLRVFKERSYATGVFLMTMLGFVVKSLHAGCCGIVVTPVLAPFAGEVVDVLRRGIAIGNRPGDLVVRGGR